MSRKFSALAFAALASIASNPASAAGEKADDKPAPIPTIVVTA
jgi:hypothetical protein